MTDSNGEFIIDRRKAIAGLGMAGVGVTTGLSFASEEDSTSDNISVNVDGGGVVDVATAESASEGGLGIEYGEVVTEHGGGVTGFAGDKSDAVLEHPPYEGELDEDDTDNYDDRVLYGVVLEDPDDVNQFLDFTVTIGNVGEVANGDPFDFLTLELALEQIEEDDEDLEPDGEDGNDDAPSLDPNEGDPTGADALVDADEDGESNPDGPESTETAVEVGSEEIVAGGDGSVTVSLANPRAQLRTRPAADDFEDSDNTFGGYRVIVTGGTASVRNIAGEDRTFDPGSDFDVDFDFSIE